MPLVDFEDEYGNVFEVWFESYKDFPCEIGETITVGKGPARFQATRLPPTLQSPLSQEECRHVSRCHPPWWEAHRKAGGTFDSRGRAIMSSWAQVERSVKTANDMGENVTYDGPAGVGEIS